MKTIRNTLVCVGFTLLAYALWYKNIISREVSVFSLEKEQTVHDLRTCVNNYQSDSPVGTILTLFNITHNGSLQEIVEQTQKKFLRPSGKERWELEDTTFDNIEQIATALKNVGLIDVVVPSCKNYTYVIVLGGIVKTVRKRLMDLIHLWKLGIRWDNIIFLGSERPLDPTIESIDKLINPEGYFTFKKEWVAPAVMPTTESEMMQFVYDQTDLPKDVASIPMILVDTPMNIAADGTKKRPTTIDTIRRWLSLSPEPGMCLFISSQPHVGYQDAVIRSVMPAHMVDTVGTAMKEIKISECLDALARWLYQTLQNTKE